MLGDLAARRSRDGHHAAPCGALPLTCGNSNIAGLVLGTDNRESMPDRFVTGRSGQLMRRIRTASLAGLCLVLGACSSAQTCDEPEFYEAAESGRRIEAPEGLDNLQAYKELKIPEASPRPPREPGSGCIDRPPTLRIGEPDEGDGEEGDESQT